MNTDLYINILDNFLVPFIQTVYPESHKFMQDNDPKHTSRRSKEFFEEKSINWWRTPPESLDANPIENLWHDLKVRKLLFFYWNVLKCIEMLFSFRIS